MLNPTADTMYGYVSFDNDDCCVKNESNVTFFLLLLVNNACIQWSDFCFFTHGCNFHLGVKRRLQLVVSG
jgi:hypothetical protein